MIYIGVDPGKKGGYAVMHSPNTVMVYPWDDALFVGEMQSVAATGQPVRAAVEKVGAMPGQGVTGMFHFGQSYGYILGVLAALEIPCQLVTPRTWKGEFGLNGSKDRSIEVCKRLFPGVYLLPTSKCRKESDGMAEAILIAEYARRKF